MKEKTVKFTQDEINELIFVLQEQIEECDDPEVTASYQNLINKLKGDK